MIDRVAQLGGRRRVVPQARAASSASSDGAGSCSRWRFRHDGPRIKGSARFRGFHWVPQGSVRRVPLGSGFGSAGFSSARCSEPRGTLNLAELLLNLDRKLLVEPCGTPCEPGSIRSYASQVLPVARGAVDRRAHPRQHVLLDHDPAVVARALEASRSSAGNRPALPQLAEDAVTKRRPGSPTRSWRARSAISGSQSLKWTCQMRSRVACRAARAAIRRRRSHGRCRGTGRRARDRCAASARRSPAASRRRSRSDDGTPCAAPVSSRTARGDPLDAVRPPRPPLASGQAHASGVNAAGRAACGSGSAVGSSDSTMTGGASVSDGRQQPRRRHRARRGSRRTNRESTSRVVTNAPTMREAAPRAGSSRNCRGVGRHEAPVAELGADVAGRRDLVEHLLVTRARRLVDSNSSTPHEQGALAIVDHRCSRPVGRAIGGQAKSFLGADG